jgi:hypothetical protein
VVEVASSSQQDEVGEETARLLRNLGCQVVHADPSTGPSWREQALDHVRKLSPGLVLFRLVEEHKYDAQQWMEAERTRLPHRYLKEHDLPDGLWFPNLLSALSRAPGSARRKTQEWILGLFKSWVLQLEQQQKPASLELVLHHRESQDTDAQRTIGATKGRWQEVLREAEALGIIDTSFRVDLDLSNLSKQLVEDQRLFVVDDHVESFNGGDESERALRDALRPRFRFWQSRGGTNRTAREAIGNPVPGFGGVLFLLELIEAGFLRVLIIDERVADHLFKADEDGAVAAIDERKLNALAAAGIEVVPFFRFADKPIMPLTPR